MSPANHGPRSQWLRMLCFRNHDPTGDLKPDPRPRCRWATMGLSSLEVGLRLLMNRSDRRTQAEACGYRIHAVPTVRRYDGVRSKEKGRPRRSSVVEVRFPRRRGGESRPPPLSALTPPPPFARGRTL